ncbi:HyaD/HybD family hydrogenase maturation endopeptidase [Desulfohalobiaceae bacterium Ax17]|jgi:hydrogenase maturation protease|uniref:HyaD/HybD family hydrogenase maturation endopeptidase n=1 Tax=Desulfovulcanus ferrireducens TaxID=2831190 RepID=UPI00207BA023|nr:HyaD/HybD family hydrogenase maturation endopeptidase [Desulfovulcanus ferrireducens]MBT8764513.1 HyaD/HybD family hydrogenase maturation endopeptidase [Desulfovulcanus ferrireducens]
MVADKPQILILGVGNILYTDEGIGVRVVEQLQERYEFSSNVSLLDGGTLGMRLMDYITQSDKLIIVDAVMGDQEPGSVYRLTGDDLRNSLSFKNSLHQTDLVDTLIYCQLIGNSPDTIVIGIQPSDLQTMSMQLSQEVNKALPQAIEKVLEEVTQAGGEYREIKSQSV